VIYAFDGRKPEIGKGAYISDQAIVIGDVEIGNCCYVGPGAILRGDYGKIVIGFGTAVEENVVVHAPPEQACQIGKKVTLGHGAIIHASSIGDLVVIGMGAVLSLGAKVGKISIVAEGAVVRMGQKVPAGIVVAGNPAEFIRDVMPEDEERWRKGKQLYIDLAKKYLKIGLHPVNRNGLLPAGTQTGKWFGKK
jgi:carbonic anhydrase/acetyltransferase-like protein (isoleucine patch superfamily)